MAIRYDDENTKAARRIIPGFRTKAGHQDGAASP